MTVLGSKTLAPALLALLIGGCPKRQTTPRVVYVQPAPSVSPSASNTAAPSTPETLIIQEPASPPAAEPAPSVVATLPAQKSQADKVTKPRLPPRESEEKSTVDTVQPAEASEPTVQLQPSGSDVGEAELDKRLEQMAAELSDLEHRTNLSQDQLRTIEDAGTFRKQSIEALHQHDLLRAKQLAEKAQLLIEAVQERP
jgi:hypothetical protein